MWEITSAQVYVQPQPGQGLENNEVLILICMMYWKYNPGFSILFCNLGHVNNFSKLLLPHLKNGI